MGSILKRTPCLGETTIEPEIHGLLGHAHTWCNMLPTYLSVRPGDPALPCVVLRVCVSRGCFPSCAGALSEFSSAVAGCSGMPTAVHRPATYKPTFNLLTQAHYPPCDSLTRSHTVGDKVQQYLRARGRRTPRVPASSTWTSSILRLRSGMLVSLPTDVPPASVHTAARGVFSVT